MKLKLRTVYKASILHLFTDCVHSCALCGGVALAGWWGGEEVGPAFAGWTSGYASEEEEGEVHGLSQSPAWTGEKSGT